MTRNNFSPLFRSTIGFDSVAAELDALRRLEAGTAGYPPYDIEKVDEDTYRVTIAVAGFGMDNLSIEERDGSLIVTGRRGGADGNVKFLHRGIAGRDFRRVFRLADYVKVAGATLANGLLSIELVRELPEAARPRRIEISTGKSSLRGAVKKLAEKVA